MEFHEAVKIPGLDYEDSDASACLKNTVTVGTSDCQNLKDGSVHKNDSSEVDEIKVPNQDTGTGQSKEDGVKHELYGCSEVFVRSLCSVEDMLAKETGDLKDHLDETVCALNDLISLPDYFNISDKQLSVVEKALETLETLVAILKTGKKDDTDDDLLEKAVVFLRVLLKKTYCQKIAQESLNFTKDPNVSQVDFVTDAPLEETKEQESFNTEIAPKEEGGKHELYECAQVFVRSLCSIEDMLAKETGDLKDQLHETVCALKDLISLPDYFNISDKQFGVVEKALEALETLVAILKTGKKADIDDDLLKRAVVFLHVLLKKSYCKKISQESVSFTKDPNVSEVDFVTDLPIDETKEQESVNIEIAPKEENRCNVTNQESLEDVENPQKSPNKVREKFHCPTCKIDMYNKHSYYMHLKGRRHKQKLSKKSFGYECKICNVRLRSKTSLKDHVSGSKHAEKCVQKDINPEYVQDPAEPNAVRLKEELQGVFFSCKMCSVKVKSGKQFLEHMKSKRHMMNSKTHQNQAQKKQVNKRSQKMIAPRVRQQPPLSTPHKKMRFLEESAGLLPPPPLPPPVPPSYHIDLDEPVPKYQRPLPLLDPLENVRYSQPGPSYMLETRPSRDNRMHVDNEYFLDRPNYSERTRPSRDNRTHIDDEYFLDRPSYSERTHLFSRIPENGDIIPRQSRNDEVERIDDERHRLLERLYELDKQRYCLEKM